MRIFFIGPTYVGDAVVVTGLLDHIIRKYPEARITVACGRVAAPIFANAPNLERLITFVKSGRIGHWIDLWRASVGTRWDLVVDLRGSGLAWLLRARERRIFRPDPRKAHSTQTLAAVLDLPNLPPPVLWTSPSDAAAAAALAPDGPPVIALGTTGNYPPKIWPAASFAELARRLSAAEGPFPGARIAVLAAGHERPIVAALLTALPTERTIDLVGRADLGVIGAVLKRSALFIGNDSGPLYLAIAAGIPAVGLFGPTPGLLGPPVGGLPAPWAHKAAVVRAQVGPAGIAHMSDLTVDAAEVAVRDLLRRVTGADSR